MHILFLVVFVVVFIGVNSSTLPAARVTLPISALNDLSGQLLPLIEEQIQNYPLEQQEATVGVPLLGDVKLTLTNIKLSGLNLRNNQKIELGGENEVVLVEKDAYVHATGNWKSYQKRFPHASDSGTFKADITSNFNIKFEMAIDHSYAGNMKVSVNSFDIDITKFDLSLHSKFSWLLSIFLKVFKSKLVRNVEDVFEKTVPQIVETMTQQQLDQFQFKFPLGPEDWNLELDFDMLQFTTNQTEQFITFSTLGVFKIENVPIDPSEPQFLKSTYFVREGMKQVQFLMDQHCMQTLSYAMHHSGKLQNRFDLPDSFNTDSFGDMIPELKKRFPNCPMTTQVQTTSPPQWTIMPNGTTLKIEGTTLFQVKLANGTLFDAFVVGVELHFEVHGSVEDTDPTMLTFKVVYLPDLTKTWEVSSNVGEIESLMMIGVGISIMVDTINNDQVNPLTQKGFPLPHIPSLKIRDSTIDHFPGFLTVNSNCKPDVMMVHNQLQSALYPKEAASTAKQSSKVDIDL